MFQQRCTVSSRRKNSRWHDSISGLVAETLKLLANSYEVYQIMNRSWHGVKTYLSDKNTHAAIKCSLFKKTKSCDQFIVWIRSRQNTNWTQRASHNQSLHSSLRKTANVGFFYDLFNKLCHGNSFEDLEKHTDSMYLPLAEKQLELTIRHDMKAV